MIADAQRWQALDPFLLPSKFELGKWIGEAFEETPEGRHCHNRGRSRRRHTEQPQGEAVVHQLVQRHGALTDCPEQEVQIDSNSASSNCFWFRSA